MDRAVEFSEFVAARGDGLVRTAALLLGRVEGAEDLVQDALMRLYRHWDRVIRGGDPDAYVYRIMTNLVVDGWRRRRPVVSVSHLPEVAQPADESLVQRSRPTASPISASCSMRRRCSDLATRRP